MRRTGLLVALAIGAVTGVVFGLYPQLDLEIARRFYGPEQGFPLSAYDWLKLARDGSMIVVGLIAGVPIGALVAKLARPGTRLAIPGRAVVFLITTLVLAPLLTANILLKDNWSRPRPRDIVAFGGSSQFVPWWDPRGTCAVNCSFIGGEAAGAFWTVAPAALAPPQWRPLAYGAALAFGTAVGLLRMSFGGHFLTDVVFAGVLTFLIIWIVHGLLYRWRASPLTDAAIERGIEYVGTLLRR